MWQENHVSLPIVLWKRVFQCGRLQLQDRLRLRGVCRAFSKFDRNETVNVWVTIQTEAKAYSLLRFLHHHAAGPSLQLTLASCEEPWFVPCLMAGAACANLQSLQLYQHVSLAQAELLLAVAPPRLQALDLQSEPQLVSCQSFSRLAHLQHLTIEASATRVLVDPQIFPSGIATLQRLHELTLVWDSIDGTKIVASNFSLPALHTLWMSGKPFTDDLDLEHFPCLHTIELPADESVPAWLGQQQIQHLKLDSLDQLASQNLSTINCRQLTLSSFAPVGIRLASLNAAVHLRKIIILEEEPWSTAGQLEGTPAEYSELLRSKELLFGAAIDLLVTGHMTADRSTCKVHLCSNGHPLLCRCTQCQESNAVGPA